MNFAKIKNHCIAKTFRSVVAFVFTGLTFSDNDVK